jgi:hypothetical protein
MRDDLQGDRVVRAGRRAGEDGATEADGTDVPGA